MTEQVVVRLPWVTLTGTPDRPGRWARVRCVAAMAVHEVVELAAGTQVAHAMPSAIRYGIGAPPPVNDDKDWPSKSEVFGTFKTLSDRLDDLDTHVVAAGGGTLNASVVLYCPTLNTSTLTPSNGDTMYWVEFAPAGLPDGDTGLFYWRTVQEFTWSPGWAIDNDPTNVLIIRAEEGMPSTLAEVTPTGFTKISAFGLQPVIVGCYGGGADFSATLWYGWNFGGDNVGSAPDPTQPAVEFYPAGMNAALVKITTGSGSSILLSDWYQQSGSTYDWGNITAQPFVQGSADLGAPSGDVNAIVTLTSNPYYVQASMFFRATVSTTSTDSVSLPKFFVHPIFQSLDAKWAGWAWQVDNAARASVYGELGGLPFVGFIQRNGDILDANGDTFLVTLTAGDYLVGTITGVFQND